MITLHLQDIFRAQWIDPATLEHVEKELTTEDIEYYDQKGWDNYKPEYHTDILLPSLGDSRYFYSLNNVVVPIKGVNYKVNFICEDFGGEIYEAKGKSVVLEPTDAKPTKPKAVDTSWRGHYDYKFFGQPVWVQNACYPAGLDGKPCYHFLTVENCWGDCGNFNILIGLDENGVPNVGYFEASCC